jgi:hypothetical protein
MLEFSERVGLGQELNAARKLVAWGEWKQWVEDNFDGGGYRTAANYMQLAREFESVEELPDQSVNAALQEIRQRNNHKPNDGRCKWKTYDQSLRISGVYVFTLPHYLRYPVDTETGNTYLKVGHSQSGVVNRFIEQTRTTALPEDPILLRVYPTENAEEMETEFHRLLVAGGHLRTTGASAGREWFLTNLDYLDEIAGRLGLETIRTKVVSGRVPPFTG